MKELKSALDLALKELGKDRISSVDAISKDLAIKLAVSALRKIKQDNPNDVDVRRREGDNAVLNLLVGLGCMEVADAWTACWAAKGRDFG